MKPIDWIHDSARCMVSFMSTERGRWREGDRLPTLSFTGLRGENIALPERDRFLHLQFRRFAGCPVCNLHLRTFAREHARLRDARVTTVAFFHSPATLMQPYQGDLPFACVADPTRHWYRYFGVERSWRAAAHPSVLWAAARGLFQAPSNPFAGGTEQAGLPADFLIDRHGVIAALHYGAHANDQWSIDELLDLAKQLG